MDNLENSDKNISLPFMEAEEDIEVLNDPKRTPKDVIKDTSRSVQNKAEEIKTSIQNEDIYESSTDIPVINGKQTKKKMDKVLKVQIILVIIWVVLTLSVYLFGYDLLEPFIPIN